MPVIEILIWRWIKFNFKNSPHPHSIADAFSPKWCYQILVCSARTRSRPTFKPGLTWRPQSHCPRGTRGSEPGGAFTFWCFLLNSPGLLEGRCSAGTSETPRSCTQAICPQASRSREPGSRLVLPLHVLLTGDFLGLPDACWEQIS